MILAASPSIKQRKQNTVSLLFGHRECKSRLDMISLHFASIPGCQLADLKKDDEGCWISSLFMEDFLLGFLPCV